MVTGAAGGIGTAFATRLAERGMDLALFDFDVERLAGLAEGLSGGGGRILTREVDVSDSDALAQALDDVEREFGGVSLCAPFAALFSNLSLEERPRARALMHAVNVRHVEACAEWTQQTAARNGMDSHVLMTSSTAAVERSPTRYYAVTKAELLDVASSARARGRRLGRHTGTHHRVTAAVLYPTRTRFGSSSARVWREHEGPEFPDASLPELDDWLVEHGGSPEHVARVLFEAVRRRKRLVFVAPSRRIAMRDSMRLRVANPVLRHPVARRVRRYRALKPRLQ